jgi:endo-1,4-beta-xylanase
VHRRLCAVAVATVCMAAVTAGHVIGGGGPLAQASTGDGSGRNAASGVVTAVPVDAMTLGDDTPGGPAAGRSAGPARSTPGAARRGKSQSPTTAATAAGPAVGRGGGGAQGSPKLTGALRALAARRGVAVGASVLTSSNLSDATYASVLGTEYSMLTPENDMKWSAVEPEPGVYDFVAPDLDVAFAQSHGMAVRGHNLAWWSSNPQWLTTLPYSRDQLIGILHDHITNVVGHYKGKVAQWDVVNEGLSGGFWWDHVGPDYIDMAFRFAHEADPGAKLFFNESGAEGLGARSDQLYNLVRGLKQRGVPIDGVGLESHFDLNPPSFVDIAANMRRLNALGLETAITELDVRIQLPASAHDLNRQATIYNGLLATCLSANCKTFTSWGFTDKVSWVPGAYPGYGAALPFDQNYAPKPAYYGLRAALGG